MKTNLKTNLNAMNKAINFEGTIGQRPSAKIELERAVLSAFLYEDSFYESGNTLVDRISLLVPKVGLDFLSKLAIRARNEMHNRHMPLLLAVEACKHYSGTRALGDLIYDVINRPDECGEIISLFRTRNPGVKCVPNQMKIGIGRALKKFSSYSLSKWKTEKGALSLQDVIFLTHANPKNIKYGKIFANLVNDTYFPEATKASGFEVIKENQLQDTSPVKVIPDTWETNLSAGEDPKETFMRLLNENKLGEMAFIRNLRLMQQHGVPLEFIKEKMTAKKINRILPFRFITAAIHNPALNAELEEWMFRGIQNMPKFNEPTAVVIDSSGSMDTPISSNSEVTRQIAACALGIMLKELCDNSKIYGFSSNVFQVPNNRRGFSIIDSIKNHVKPESTNLALAIKTVYDTFPEVERIIVITDEQSQTIPIYRKNVKHYIINVCPYTVGLQESQNVLTINGWGSEVLNYIRCIENPLANKTEK